MHAYTQAWWLDRHTCNHEIFLRQLQHKKLPRLHEGWRVLVPIKIVCAVTAASALLSSLHNTVFIKHSSVGVFALNDLLFPPTVQQTNPKLSGQQNLFLLTPHSARMDEARKQIAQKQMQGIAPSPMTPMTRLLEEV